MCCLVQPSPHASMWFLCVCLPQQATTTPTHTHHHTLSLPRVLVGFCLVPSTPFFTLFTPTPITFCYAPTPLAAPYLPRSPTHYLCTPPCLPAHPAARPSPIPHAARCLCPAFLPASLTTTLPARCLPSSSSCSPTTLPVRGGFRRFVHFPTTTTLTTTHLCLLYVSLYFVGLGHISTTFNTALHLLMPSYCVWDVRHVIKTFTTFILCSYHCKRQDRRAGHGLLLPPHTGWQQRLPPVVRRKGRTTFFMVLFQPCLWTLFTPCSCRVTWRVFNLLY